MEIKIINKSNHRLPEYKTPLSAGMDLKANISDPVKLNPMERILIPTGLYIALPEGYGADIKTRSGLALKYGIIVLNGDGLIDADYRNEIGVILFNACNEPFLINPGDRIAQMTVTKYEKVEWKEVSELDETERGKGGFGSTGV